MKSFWQTIKRHLVALIAYICYLLFWWFCLNAKLNYRAAAGKLNEGDRVAWGEGVMYGQLLSYGVSIGTTIVMLLNMVVNKEERLFYLVMALLFIIPLAISILKYDIVVL